MGWYSKAAQQVHANAQYNLAAIYEEGDGVPRDPVQALVWYNLAAKCYPASQIKNRDAAISSGEGIAANLNPDQIAEAQRRITEWPAGFRSTEQAEKTPAG